MGKERGREREDGKGRERKRERWLMTHIIARALSLNRHVRIYTLYM